MFLKSDHLYLRALETTDLDFLYKLENDTRSWQVSNTVTPYSKELLQEYLLQAGADIYAVKQLRLLICTSEHEPAGAIDLYDFDPAHLRAGIGIIISQEFRRQQLATEALTLLLNYCHQFLLLHQVYCTIAVTNTSSLSLFKKAGFQSIGLRKDWVRTASGFTDVCEFQKIYMGNQPLHFFFLVVLL